MKKITKNLILISLTLILGGALVSCKGKTTPQPAVKNIQHRRNVAAKKNKVVTDIKAAEDKELSHKRLTYNPEGRRDPFKPFITKTTVKEEKKRPLSPLQKYSIGQLKLVAIIWGIRSPRAMVEVPEGKGYIVKRGSLIGNRNGRVIRILKDKIIIRERFRDAFGEIKTNDITLELPKEEGEEISFE